MTTIWIDAQLSPALAAWVNRTCDESTPNPFEPLACAMPKTRRYFKPRGTRT